MNYKNIIREAIGVSEDVKSLAEFLHNGSESPLISFAVGGMKATQYKDNNYFK